MKKDILMPHIIQEEQKVDASIFMYPLQSLMCGPVHECSPSVKGQANKNLFEIKF
jgi:hypothetical protein